MLLEICASNAIFQDVLPVQPMESANNAKIVIENPMLMDLPVLSVLFHSVLSVMLPTNVLPAKEVHCSLI